jgi:hypothetical protein
MHDDVVECVEFLACDYAFDLDPSMKTESMLDDRIPGHDLFQSLFEMNVRDRGEESQTTQIYPDDWDIRPDGQSAGAQERAVATQCYDQIDGVLGQIECRPRSAPSLSLYIDRNVSGGRPILETIEDSEDVGSVLTVDDTQTSN